MHRSSNANSESSYITYCPALVTNTLRVLLSVRQTRRCSLCYTTSCFFLLFWQFYHSHRRLKWITFFCGMNKFRNRQIRAIHNPAAPGPTYRNLPWKLLICDTFISRNSVLCHLRANSVCIMLLTNWSRPGWMLIDDVMRNVQVMMRFVFGDATLDQTFLCDTFIGNWQHVRLHSFTQSLNTSTHRMCSSPDMLN